MGKILVVAEKPSVARDMAKVLKCNKKADGYLIGDNYIITWAIGHLITLLEPEDYNAALKKWRFNTLPIIPKQMMLKPIQNTKKQFQIVKNLLNSDEVESIICATDSGREGELIFRYIYEICECKKPFQRLWISSMTDEAINEGFRNLKDGKEYDNLYQSAKCRSEADWLVGMNATRAFTIKFDTLLSVGRVQTPTLAIIVEKQKEINAFNSAEYFEVTAQFEEFKATWIDEEIKDTKITDEKRAKEITEKVIHKEGTVVSIENEDKKMPAPLLYDLTELQRDANKKFGFTAQKTLTVAQELYEKRKLITYPRTDSRYLSKDMISKIKGIISRTKSPAYEEYAKYILSLKELPITKRIVDDAKVTDHHAIIPTEIIKDTSKLTQDEYKIYDLVVKRFLSVFYPNYIYKITKIVSNVEGENFLTKGKTILQNGWMEIYKNEETKEDDEQELPMLKEDDIITVQKADIIKKKTKPPSAYTEASLLSAMENAGRFVEDEELKDQLKEGGLGTPATRAAIIERLINVGYVTRKGKRLIPSEKGMKLIEIVPPELKSPETTGKWERGLTSISKGKLQSERFMQSITRYVKYIVQHASRANGSVVFEDKAKEANFDYKSKSVAACPNCKEGYILEHEKGFYCSNWRKGCKFSLWKSNYEKQGKVLDGNMVREILNNR